MPKVPENSMKPAALMTEEKNALECERWQFASLLDMFENDKIIADYMGVDIKTIKRWRNLETRPTELQLAMLGDDDGRYGAPHKSYDPSWISRRSLVMKLQWMFDDGDTIQELAHGLAGAMRDVGKEDVAKRLTYNAVRSWINEEHLPSLDIAKELEYLDYWAGWDPDPSVPFHANHMYVRQSVRDKQASDEAFHAPPKRETQAELNRVHGHVDEFRWQADGSRMGQPVPGGGEPEDIRQLSDGVMPACDPWTAADFDRVVKGMGGWRVVAPFYGYVSGEEIKFDIATNDRARAFWQMKLRGLEYGRRVYGLKRPLVGKCQQIRDGEEYAKMRDEQKAGAQ